MRCVSVVYKNTILLPLWVRCMRTFCPHLDLLVVNNGPDFGTIDAMCRTLAVPVRRGYARGTMTPSHHHGSGLDIAWRDCTDDALLCDSDCMPIAACQPDLWLRDSDIVAMTRAGLRTLSHVRYPSVILMALSSQLPHNLSFRPLWRRGGYADTGARWSTVIANPRWRFREMPCRAWNTSQHHSKRMPWWTVMNECFIHFGDGSNWRRRQPHQDQHRNRLIMEFVETLLSNARRA